MSLTILKMVTILAPAAFIAVFEVTRHEIFVEHQPMLIGNIVIFGVVLGGAFLFSRIIFGIIERTQRETLRRNQELAALNSVALTVSESLNPEVVLYRALDKVLQVTQMEMGTISLVEPPGAHLVLRAHQGISQQFAEEEARIPLGECLCGLAGQSGEIITTENVAEDPRSTRKACKEAGFRYRICLPLFSGERVVGVMSLGSTRQPVQQSMQWLSTIGTQVGTAIENARLHEKVQGMAALEERERIAREMHDSLAQVLSYVNTKTQAARQLLASGQETQAEAHLKELEDVAQETYADVREVILGLRTTATPQREMASALKEYIFRFSQLSNIRTELEISDGRPPSLPTAAELQVIRIIQEALTNVRKHAQASHAWVRISTEGDQVRIVIEDDGQGFDVSHIRRGEWPRFGLQTMRERAESVRGTLDIKSAPGQGTKVTLMVPQAQGAGT